MWGNCIKICLHSEKKRYYSEPPFGVINRDKESSTLDTREHDLKMVTLFFQGYLFNATCGASDAWLIFLLIVYRYLSKCTFPLGKSLFGHHIEF